MVGKLERSSREGLLMSFLRPTLQELKDRIVGDIETSLDSKIPLLKKNVLRVFGTVFAGAIHTLFGFLVWISKQCFPDTAEKEYLERWASLWNITRKVAVFAEGNFTATGTNGQTILSGSLWLGRNAIEYETLADATISAGVAVIPVRAKTSGSIGNLDASEILTIVSPQIGINSEGTVDAIGIVNGIDAETDDELRARLVERIQNPPQGGAKTDYVIWAKEISGVTRAWCYPMLAGAGTVSVTFVLDNAVNIIPDSTKRQEVYDYIETKRPATAELFVFALTPVIVNFRIKLYPDNADNRAAVTAELSDLILTKGEPDGILFISQINEAISSSTGEIDHRLDSPVDNIVLTKTQIAKLGTITWV